MQGLELGGQGEGRARVLKPGAPWPSPLQPSLHPDCFCSWSLQVGGGTWSPPPPPAALLWLIQALPPDGSVGGLEGAGPSLPAAHYPLAYVSLGQVASLVRVFKSKLLT